MRGEILLRQISCFTREPTTGYRHIRIGRSANPTVRTR